MTAAAPTSLVVVSRGHYEGRQSFQSTTDKADWLLLASRSKSSMTQPAHLLMIVMRQASLMHRPILAIIVTCNSQDCFVELCRPELTVDTILKAPTVYRQQQ
ncbi:hypothetical protein WJX79_003889 [Trebouxia sp. C0005]